MTTHPPYTVTGVHDCNHALTVFTLQFDRVLQKMKKWIEMAKLPENFQLKIEALERKFEVASIIYDKYRKVFQDLFLLVEDQSVSSNTRQRSRKSRGKWTLVCLYPWILDWCVFR